ncbi:MAG: SUMF1/EgtB/PvdO family nonheme iron enzyme [Sphingobacteriales bacterium]|nr:SUMF1/EgtB/PvdO family nonheme iron enzyme [Sphingobacteriales bacterium]
MKQKFFRFRTMRTTITLFFVVISTVLFAQSSTEKLPGKNLIPNLVYIAAKSFTSLSYTGKDSNSFYGPRVATVPGFYISKTEVTNKEYREFTQYVKDSIAHTLLQHFQGNSSSIDWNQKIDWEDDRLEPMIIPADERIQGKKEIDVEKLKYELEFFGNKENIAVYPDTLVWLTDFAYSYNEPLAKKYFSHSSYNDYPVVGISLKQAIAFCQWKTGQLKKKLSAGSEIILRLPSSNEWESAAFDLEETRSLFSKDKKYNCNFGQIRADASSLQKDFKDDGFFYTGPVKSYPAGPFGLYDMRGNVNEWTSTSRDEISGIDVSPDKQKTSFIVKGGGWNSTPFYLQAGVCQFLPSGDAHSYVGFRYVVFVTKKI